MVSGSDVTLTVPDLSGRLAVVTGANAAASPDAQGTTYYGPRGFYETVGGGVTFAHLPRLACSGGDNDRLWRLSEQLTGVTYPD